MTRRQLTAAALAVCLLAPACAARQAPASSPDSSAPAATLTQSLDRLFSTPPFDTALWGVKIARLESGDVLYERNARTLLMPASNMKIVTMATAAEVLGWDYRFETRLASSGPIENGVLQGDLVVIGGGDPSIAAGLDGTTPLFAEWARALGDLGVRRVTGRIIGDDNTFDDDELGQGWAWDYLSYGYAAPVSGLQFNENIVVLSIEPGATVGAPAKLTVQPDGHGLEIVNEVTTTPADQSGSTELVRMAGFNRLVVRGRVPVDATRPLVRTAAIDNPTLFFVRAFRQALIEYGIAVDGDAVDTDALESAPARDSLKTLASHGSPTLASLGAAFMKRSQNLYGETFLKAMGRAKSGEPGTASKGRDAVADVLKQWDVAPGGYVIYDGSGLSRYSNLSADLLVKVLRAMWMDERDRALFAATLPVAGHDGTLDARMRETLLARNVQAKTGTIAHVRALSGYLTLASGERVVFSMLANNFLRSSSEADKIAEAALREVLERVR